MKIKKNSQSQKGQAMIEAVLAIPILFLFAAGIILFTILFTSRVQFEHSFGEAARQYAAGLIDKDSLGPKIHENLGSFQRYFDNNSLTVTTQTPRSMASSALDQTRNAIHFIPLTLNYDGYEWAVDIKCTPPFFFATFFPAGIPFHTVMQVYRYPR